MIMVEQLFVLVTIVKIDLTALILINYGVMIDHHFVDRDDQYFENDYANFLFVVQIIIIPFLVLLDHLN